jgi:hypothetical protein
MNTIELIFFTRQSAGAGLYFVLYASHQPASLSSGGSGTADLDPQPWPAWLKWIPALVNQLT